MLERGTAWEYLLADALGSMRQIVDESGNVTLAESYEPYGSVLSSLSGALIITGELNGGVIDPVIRRGSRLTWYPK